MWSPAVSGARAPIVLLHDSLGSVELWRGFPEALCAATGRQVVAYDRLGFGRSDAHPATLALDFIAREGYDAVYGARPLKRFMVRRIETPIARMIISGEAAEGSRIVVDERDGALSLSAADL